MRGLLFALLFALPTAHAVDIAPCLECHATPDRHAAIPLLSGQHRGYLSVQLQRFRDHLRESFPMDALARGLDDEVIDAIARKLSKRKWKPVQQPSSESELASGRSLTERFACTSCHGPKLLGADVIPRLAGQNSAYLERQIKAFADGKRHHPPTGTGARMYNLDEPEIAAVVAYLNALR